MTLLRPWCRTQVDQLDDDPWQADGPADGPCRAGCRKVRWDSPLGLLREAIELGSRKYTYDLVIDLSEVDYLPSIGIGALIGAMRNAEEQGRSVHLVASTGTIVEKVLNISGVPHLTSRG